MFTVSSGGFVTQVNSKELYSKYHLELNYLVNYFKCLKNKRIPYGPFGNTAGKF